MTPADRVADALYRVVLCLFSAPMRQRRGEAMVEHFREQRHVLRGRPFALVSLWMHALGDAIQHSLLPRVRRRRTELTTAPSASLTAGIMRDAVDACRMLRSSPRTTFGVWVVMTVTLAAATLVFTVVDHIAIRPLPYGDPASLIAVLRVEGARPTLVPPQDFVSWSDRADHLESIGASSGWSSLRLTTEGGPVRLVTHRATHAFFATMGVAPILGRGFEASHEVTGGDPVIVLSEKVWRQQFNADPSVIGRALPFGTESRRVVGIMPAGFAPPLGMTDEPDVWIPFVFRAMDRDHASGGRSHSLMVVGRLKSGVTLAQARAQIESITEDVRTQFPSAMTWQKAHVQVTSLHDAVVGPARAWMLLALAAVGVVLLLASANVANLMLAQATSRTRELAVRAAIGASASRLARVALFESVLITVAAAAAGLAVTAAGLQAVVAALPDELMRSEVTMDGRVFAAAAFCALVAGIIAGLVPARQAARADVMSLLRASGIPPRSRVRSALVASQLAFVVVLVFTTAVFVGSFLRVTSVDLGFDHEGRAAWSITGLRPVPAPGVAPEEASTAARVHDASLVERIRSLPGVMASALIDTGDPFSSSWVNYSVTPVGRTLVDPPRLDIHNVTPGYADAAGLRLHAGRFLNDQDVAGAPAVAVISDDAARQLFPDGSAVGQSVMFRRPLMIVGVVTGVRTTGPESNPRAAMYMPMAQTEVDPRSSMSLFVRSHGPVASVLPAVRAALAPFVRAGQQPPVPRVLTERFRDATAGRRVMSEVMTSFGLLAVFIGMFGVYGVLASLVAQQRREFGVRLALGATRSSILGGVLRHTLLLVGIGLAGGLTISWLVTDTLATLVVGIEPTHPALFAATIVVVTTTAFAAALLPAVRAARVDPVIALRSE